jgi:hypothetical protein
MRLSARAADTDAPADLYRYPRLRRILAPIFDFRFLIFGCECRLRFNRKSKIGNRKSSHIWLQLRRPAVHPSDFEKFVSSVDRIACNSRTPPVHCRPLGERVAHSRRRSVSNISQGTQE